MPPPGAGKNVALQLLGREVRPGGVAYCAAGGAARPGSKRKLEQWQEADFVQNCGAAYSSFQPPPRSTIALSYNCDGTLLASTHGDHTVKLSCCASGKLLRVLSGHRRTPWVVRFHPRKPALLASGSLDHEVRLWDAQSGQCITRHTFGKPIASLAFYVSADMLAIACGHKLYSWEYTVPGMAPTIVLKTRRSMRAVHFHPHGLPLLLTAEVQDPSPTGDLPPSLTETGPFTQLGAAAEKQQARAFAGEPAPSQPPPSSQWPPRQPSTAIAIQQQQQQQPGPPTSTESIWAPRRRQQQQQHSFGASSRFAADAPDGQPSLQSLSDPLEQLQLRSAATSPALGSAAGPSGRGQPEAATGSAAAAGTAAGEQQRIGAPGWLPPGSAQLPASMVPTGWELPFPATLFASGQPARGAQGAEEAATPEAQWAATAASLPHVMAAFSAAAWNIIGEEQPPRVRLRLWRFDCNKPGAPLESGHNLRLQVSDAVLCSEMGVHFSPCGRLLAATTAVRAPLPAAVGGPSLGDLGPGEAPHMPADQEELLPPFVVGGPPSNDAASHLNFPSGPPATVSEFQAAVSAALRGDPRQAEALVARHGLRELGSAPLPEDIFLAAMAAGAEGSCAEAAAARAAVIASELPPRPERVVFEVRVFSLDASTFGRVMCAKRIRAAHCLTSVQFSPACDHLLLAYGKKHISLLRSLVAERGGVVPLHTILEVYRLSDMQLARVLPSADDEINAASFHPRPGGGVAYGTKEGRLRVIAHDRSSLSKEEGGHSWQRASGSTLQEEQGEQAQQHPTQRELENLREWVLTQQWLQQQAGLGDRGGGGGAGGGGDARGAAGGVSQAQLHALQQLWDRRS